MTDPKRPLPTLRFVIYARPHTVRLIPQTTPKGKVLPGLWAIPGGAILHTDAVIETCRVNSWKYEIVGNDGTRKRGRHST